MNSVHIIQRLACVMKQMVGEVGGYFESALAQYLFFTFSPIILLFNYGTTSPSFVIPFLFISLIFYAWMFFNSSNATPDMIVRQEIGVAKQVCKMGIHTSVISLFISDIHSLLIFRYTSWIFSFPFLLEIEAQIENKQDRARLTKCKSLMTWVYVLTILDEYLQCFFLQSPSFIGPPTWICQPFIWGITLAFLYYYNVFPEFRRTYSNINFTVGVYGGVYVLRQANIITDIWYYVALVFMDVLAKCNVLMSNVHTKTWNNRMKDIHVLRLIKPQLKQALQSGLIDDVDYMNYSKMMDMSKDNLVGLRNELMEDLFPKSAIDSVLSGTFNYTIHDAMAVMFVDMVSYTSFVHQNPLEEVVHFMNDFYCNMDMITHRHGVDKVETIGDAYLVVSEDIDKCISCALEMLRQYKDAVRIGMHVGRVASCIMGLFKIRNSYVGHAVNMAARMESNGVPGQLHVSEDIKQLADKNRWIFTPREGLVTLKGIGEVQTYFCRKNVSTC